MERVLEPGDVVAGKYRIDAIAGEGGMGIVYSAHHLLLARKVAIKVLTAAARQDVQLFERFTREAQAVAQLDSEHVVRVLDAGALEDGLPFLVMEHLDGCDLAERVLLEGPLAVVDVADAVLQAAAALAEAHAVGIVHRDVKPANLFLAARDDDERVVKVLDFGISKQAQASDTTKQLTGRAILGTPAYMSPEQLRSSRNVDARADIWSLGVTMYELLTGALPFEGDGAGEMFAAILEGRRRAISTHRSDVPAQLVGILDRCLQGSPDDRFADVGELARALAPLGTGRWTRLVDTIERTLGRARRGSAPSIGAIRVASTGRALPEPASITGLAVNVLRTSATLHAEPTPVPVRPRRRATAIAAAAAIVGLSSLAAAFATRAPVAATSASGTLHALASAIVHGAPIAEAAAATVDAATRIEAPAPSTTAPIPSTPTTRAPRVAAPRAPRVTVVGSAAAEILSAALATSGAPPKPGATAPKRK